MLYLLTIFAPVGVFGVWALTPHIVAWTLESPNEHDNKALEENAALSGLWLSGSSLRTTACATVAAGFTVYAFVNLDYGPDALTTHSPWNVSVYVLMILGLLAVLLRISLRAWQRGLFDRRDRSI